MKILISSFFIILVMLGCEQRLCGCNPTLFDTLDGRWKLVKIGIGFPPREGPSEIKPTYEEILTFNASKGTFTRTKDGKVIENTKLKIGSLTTGNGDRETIIFEASNTYSFASFTQSPYLLVLYQSSPVGAQLADGNNFFYEKIE